MGLDRLLLAMQTVVEKIPHALLIIGGRGPLKDQLSALVERLALTKHVHMAGFIPEDQLPRYYQMADLFVLPTQELEGFGMVTLEALASGLPVLGTPVGGTNEILPGLDRRLVLSDSNPQTMAQGIIDYHQQIQKASDRSSLLTAVAGNSQKHIIPGTPMSHLWNRFSAPARPGLQGKDSCRFPFNCSGRACAGFAEK